VARATRPASRAASPAAECGGGKVGKGCNGGGAVGKPGGYAEGRQARQGRRHGRKARRRGRRWRWTAATQAATRKWLTLELAKDPARSGAQTQRYCASFSLLARTRRKWALLRLSTTPRSLLIRIFTTSASATALARTPGAFTSDMPPFWVSLTCEPSPEHPAKLVTAWPGSMGTPFSITKGRRAVSTRPCRFSTVSSDTKCLCTRGCHGYIL